MAASAVSPSRKSPGNRNALYKTRGISPTFKEILRDRCHSRIKARRRSLMEQFRMRNNDELRTELSNILHEEVDDLKSESFNANEFQAFGNIAENWEDDEDKCIIEEYEKVLAEEEAFYQFDWDNEVICPLCERSVLRHDGIHTQCKKCYTVFPEVPSLTHLRECLNSILSSHQQDCSEIAQFAIISDGNTNGLYLICDSCGFFLSAV